MNIEPDNNNENDNRNDSMIIIMIKNDSNNAYDIKDRSHNKHFIPGSLTLVKVKHIK